MKINPRAMEGIFGIYDSSDYAEEITGAALFKINGGAQVENSNEGVAGAQVGDTIIRNDGTEVTLTQGDITWAQEQVGAGGNSGNTGSTGVNSQGSTNSNYQGSSSGQTGGEEKHQDEETSYNYNPNEPDSDKRYNAKDYDGKHLMTIRYDDKENFEDFAFYYSIIGQYGAAGTIKYDGLALTDKKGNVISVLKTEKEVLNYAESINPTYFESNKNLSEKWNTTYIENNQLKTEKTLFINSKKSRYGVKDEIGVWSFKSKALNEGLTAGASIDFLSASKSAIDSPEECYSYSFSLNAASIGGSIGVNVFGKRIMIGAEVGVSIGAGFEWTDNSFTLSLPILKGLSFSWENSAGH